jgi:alpha-1,2-mannosyltransferase
MDDRRWAWTLWLVLLLIVGGIMGAGNRRSVTPTYREAAQHWWNGVPLYADTGRGFLYLPASALAFSPLAILPPTAGEILWRVMTIGSFAYAVSRLCRLLGRHTGRELFLLATLFSLPLAWSSARNGQATLPMTAGMILAAVAAAEERWWKAAGCLAFGVALKPLAIVMALLLAAVHRPLRLPLAAGVAVVLLLPFAFQWPAYVWGQYALCAAMLRRSSEVGLTLEWAQLFSLLQIAGAPVSPTVQTVIRLLAAAATLGLAFTAQRRWPRPWASYFHYALAASYLMLFNPRTENNTYSCLAPALGIAFAVAWQTGRRLHAAAFAFLALAIVGSWQIGKLALPSVSPVWLAPLAATIFTAILLRQIVRGPHLGDRGQSMTDKAPNISLPQRRAA